MKAKYRFITRTHMAILWGSGHMLRAAVVTVAGKWPSPTKTVDASITNHTPPLVAASFYQTGFSELQMTFEQKL